MRRFVIDDADAMYANWASEDEVTEFLTWPKHADTEVTRAVLESWIQRYKEVGFNRIAADHAKTNPKSGRVMQKIGMTYEGTWRKAYYTEQGLTDKVWYSILRDEYMGDVTE